MCVLYLSVWVTSPFLSYGTLYRVIALASIATWIFLELFDKRSVFLKPTKYLLVLYFFIFYTVSVSYLVDGIPTIKRYLQFYIMLSFLFMYASYDRKSLDILKPVMYINIILFTIWMLTTYSVLLENSHAARYVIRSDDEAKEFAMRGVGGFSFVYSLLIYIIAVLGLVKHRIKQKKIYNLWTLFMVFSVVMGVLVVLKAEYSTAVLLMTLSLFFFFFHSNNLKKNIVMMFGMVLIFIALEYYIIDILKAILPYTEGTNYYHKVLDSINSINSGEATGTAADRTERYIRSLHLFFDNPLVGVWSFGGVGKHSLILDTFAQFGIFGGIGLLYILLKVPIQLYKKSRVDKTVPLVVIFLIIALSGLNNVSMDYGFIFYIFYPAVWQRIENA
jgi:hypothetical protein